jgi:hypothetical protein
VCWWPENLITVYLFCISIAAVACTASVDSKVWFPENPGLEFIPGKTSVAVIGARNLGKTAVNVSAAWAQLALVSNAEGSIYNFSAAVSL